MAESVPARNALNNTMNSVSPMERGAHVRPERLPQWAVGMQDPFCAANIGEHISQIVVTVACQADDILVNLCANQPGWNPGSRPQGEPMLLTIDRKSGEAPHHGHAFGMADSARLFRVMNRAKRGEAMDLDDTDPWRFLG